MFDGNRTSWDGGAGGKSLEAKFFSYYFSIQAKYSATQYQFMIRNMKFFIGYRLTIFPPKSRKRKKFIDARYL